MRKASVRDLRRDRYDRSQSQADIVVENMTPDGVRRKGCIEASPRRQHLRQQEEQALQQDHHRERARPQLPVLHRRNLRRVRLRHLEIH